jgi:L-lactate dehydrogenase (cytochrome)
MLCSPGWLAALWQNGRPGFANIAKYAGSRRTTNDIIDFARTEIGGAFTWEEVAQFRDKWKKPLALKGILHPADARRALSLGIDGVWVSNHGGRQVEALPAAVDVLPAIAAEVGSRATVLFDSGVRSGHDVVRALALGARAAFAGKAFLWGLGAAGADGPGHVIDLLIDEARAVLGQIGVASPAAARSVVTRHPGALAFLDDPTEPVG